MSAPTIDIGKVVSDLRDNMSRHDKPVAFLFGAGTSCSVSAIGATDPLIPSVAGLTSLCAVSVKAMGGKFSDAWDALEKNCVEAALPPHIENLLSRLRLIGAVLGDKDQMLGVSRKELWQIEEQVRKTIAKAVNPDLATIPEETPHRALGAWISKISRNSPIEIFTVNYDVLFEHALEAERVPFFDGFVGGYRPFFLAETLRRAELAPGRGWTRLWKIHGSVTWSRVSVGSRPRVVRGPPTVTGEMILPSFEKYDESRQQPYAAFIDRLQRFLEQDDSLLITCGFSFGDEHINSVIYEALIHRPRTHVYALFFADAPTDSPVIARAKVLKNLTLLTPNSAHIGGVSYGICCADDLPGNPNLFKRAAATPAVPKPLNGTLHIGDFRVFSDFLKSFA